MKYKVEDKVKIKTWEGMKKEYGLRSSECINPEKFQYPGWNYIKSMEEKLKHLFKNRILTIKKVNKNHYIMKNISWKWVDETIDYKIEPEIFEPILSRFELLDL